MHAFCQSTTSTIGAQLILGTTCVPPRAVSFRAKSRSQRPIHLRPRISIYFHVHSCAQDYAHGTRRHLAQANAFPFQIAFRLTLSSSFAISPTIHQTKYLDEHVFLAEYP
jgi:hypothetical protein